MIYRIILSAFVVSVAWWGGSSSGLFNNKPEPVLLPFDSLSPAMQRFILAYPDHFRGGNDSCLVWNDGTEMRFDDGDSTKDYYGWMKNADLEDHFKIPYPVDKPLYKPKKNEDPGIIRYEPFFRKMYGNTKEEVVERLVQIDFLPEVQEVRFKVTTVNEVDKKLMAVAKELESMPEVHKYLENMGGTFNWRQIAGTNNVSMHSFGIAIDINVKESHYWRWKHKNVDITAGTDVPYMNNIPEKIVKVFEKHGFIWGGRWYHYDTMHFEYRPELMLTDSMLLARLAAGDK
jgi:hypothetical protein